MADCSPARVNDPKIFITRKKSALRAFLKMARGKAKKQLVKSLFDLLNRCVPYFRDETDAKNVCNSYPGQCKENGYNSEF